MNKASVSLVALATALAAPAVAQTAAQPAATLSVPAATTSQAVPAGAATEPQPEAAGDQIQEIVVTAQKRAENAQKVPIAIDTFTSAALQARGISDVAQLSNIAPNVTLDAGTPNSGSSAVLSAFIRGIGANDFAFNIDPGVGIYLDGVYLARSVGANQDLPDVERVEVLKGPQGTLFGRNTIGGAISIVTHTPGDKFAFKGDVTTGSYRLIQVRGTMDLPITDGLSSSVSFSVKNRQGYLRRIPYPGDIQFNNPPVTSFRAAGYDGIGYGREGGDNSWSVRGKLNWDNGGRVRATLSGDYTNIDQSQIANTLIKTFPGVFAGTYNCAIAGIAGGAACGNGPPPIAYIGGIGGINTITDLPSLFGVNADGNAFNNRVQYDDRFVTGNKDTSYATGNNFSKTKIYGVAGTVSFDLTDALQLKSITAYRELHWTAGLDLDGSPLNFFQPSFRMNQWQFSQELQLIGHALDRKLNYVLGGYYFKEAGNLHDYLTFAEGLLQVDGPNNLSTQNYAFFGQADWRLTDLIGVTVGGRYTHEDKEFEGFQSDVNGLTYKILQQLGVPPCLNLQPISDACRIAAGYPNPGQPLRYYIAGVQHKTFNNFSPKVGVQLYPMQDVMVYGSWSRGYKTGGWTTRLSNPLPYAPSFGPEKAETFEVGVKSTLLDRRLQLNAAAFTTRYEGIQLNFQQGISPTIQNAGNARIKGFEVEAIVLPVRHLTLTASVGYLDAKYTSVDPGAQVAAADGTFGRYGVFAGATLPKTPKWKFNVGPQYVVDLGNGGSLTMLADYTHTTPLKNDTEGTFLLVRDTTDILGASLQYKAPEHWSLTVGGTNLTNDRYLVTGAAQLAGGQVIGTYNRPREWYARLAVNF